MRFAHISDLHFGSFSLSPLQFFSKRWLGNFNFLLNRKKSFSYERLIELIDLFKKENITHVIITGDLSVTSRRIEFKMGERFVNLLKKEGFTVFTVPGNHDHYTRRSDKKKQFYQFFHSRFDADCPLNLKDHKVTYTKLQEGLWLLAIDSAFATSLISSHGHFSTSVEKHLEKALETIPKHDSIILINHFPFFEHEAPVKQMLRAAFLKDLLTKYPNILLYLHGHTHRQIVADLRANQLPIISDTGSTPHRKGGACHLFELCHNEVKLNVYEYDSEWKGTKEHTFHV